MMTKDNKRISGQIYRGNYQNALMYAKRLATESNSNVTTLNCTELKQPGDLAGVLTNLRDNDILLLANPNSLCLESETVLSYFRDAIRDNKISVMMDRYAKTPAIEIELCPFHIIVNLEEGEIIPPYLLSSIYNNAFLYICHNNELRNEIGEIRKELESEGIPYFYCPMTDHYGWRTITETISLIDSAKYVLRLYKGISKDAYGIDEFEYAVHTKVPQSIIEVNIDTSSFPISDLRDLVSKY